MILMFQLLDFNTCIIGIITFLHPESDMNNVTSSIYIIAATKNNTIGFHHHSLNSVNRFRELDKWYDVSDQLLLTTSSHSLTIFRIFPPYRSILISSLQYSRPIDHHAGTAKRSLPALSLRASRRNLTLTSMVNDDYKLQVDASSSPDHFSLLGIQVLEDHNLVDDHWAESLHWILDRSLSYVKDIMKIIFIYDIDEQNTKTSRCFNVSSF